MKKLEAVLTNIFITLLAKILSFSIFIFSIDSFCIHKQYNDFVFQIVQENVFLFNCILWLTEFQPGPGKTLSPSARLSINGRTNSCARILQNFLLLSFFF